jgi:hypothetical protein
MELAYEREGPAMGNSQPLGDSPSLEAIICPPRVLSVASPAEAGDILLSELSASEGLKNES